MALKLQNKETENIIPHNIQSGIVYEYSFVKRPIPYLPPTAPLKDLPQYSYALYKPIKFPTPPALNMPETSLPRALNYYADYGGCGFWRMIWPETTINAYQKGCISGLTCMVMDVRFYQNIKSIRFQRQATPVQNLFIKELVKRRDEFKYQMIYEVDDVVFRNDIPDYNKCKEAFASSEIEETILDIISSMDEMTVTCQFMKEYYLSKTSCKKITVIPNYAPKFWLGRFYNPDKMAKLFEEQKKKPRILYAGSGTHIDIANRNNMKDDFSHVVQEIIKARKKFKFVWKGAFPLAVKPFIDSGEMELLPWSPLYNLPQDIYNANCIASFAPLANNNFNKSKSNIKMVESGAFGMPGAFQDLCTYKEAELKFNNGVDLINQLEVITKDWTSYSKFSKNIYDFTDKLWLEDHLDEYEAVYFTPWGSQERNLKSPNLIFLNPDQKI